MKHLRHSVVALVGMTALVGAAASSAAASTVESSATASDLPSAASPTPGKQVGVKVTGPGGTYVPKSGGVTPMATWGACGVSSDQWKLVRTFQRVGNAQISSGNTRLYCGNYGSSGWGYRHIEEGHSQDFLNLAYEVGSSDWRSMADWMMVQALGWPAYIVKQGNGNFLYKTQVQIRDSGGTIRDVKYSNVVLNGDTSHDIITAFPSSS